MSWSSGSYIFGELIDALQETSLGDDERKVLYKTMIDTFTDFDCDTLDECKGKDLAFDEVFDSIYIPEDDED